MNKIWSEGQAQVRAAVAANRVAIEAKLTHTRIACDNQRRRIAALRGERADFRSARTRNTGTAHRDLAQYRAEIAWWLRADAPPPIGAANDNDALGDAMVMDRNPKPHEDGDDLVRFSQVNGGRRETDAATGSITHGGLRFSAVPRRATEYVQVDGEMVDRVFRVPVGTLTHLSDDGIHWYRVRPEAPKIRVDESSRATSARLLSRRWYSELLGAALPHGKKRRGPRRHVREMPEAWGEFWAKHPNLHGEVDLASARAAYGLAPAPKPMAGLPWKPEPCELFWSLRGNGKGAAGFDDDADDQTNRVRAAADHDYGPEDWIADRQMKMRFRQLHPSHAQVIDRLPDARCVADLVAGNDNGAGKRQLKTALAALKSFLAA